MNIDFHCHYLPANFPDLVRDIAHMMRDRAPIIGVSSLVGPTQEDIDGILGGIAAALLKL